MEEPNVPDVSNIKCKVFKSSDETFFILGPFQGHTKKKVERLIEVHGRGTVIKDYTDVSLKRVIVSPSIWCATGTAAMSLTLKAIIATNKENFDDGDDAEDPHVHRIWLLPLEWVYECLEAEELLPESDWDLEWAVEAKREERAKELLAEKKRMGGHSKYARGERRRVEREAEIRRVVQEHDRAQKLEEEAAKKAAELAPVVVSKPSSGASRGLYGLGGPPGVVSHVAIQQTAPPVTSTTQSYSNLPVTRPTASSLFANALSSVKRPSSSEDPDPWDLKRKKIKHHKSFSNTARLGANDSTLAKKDTNAPRPLPRPLPPTAKPAAANPSIPKPGFSSFKSRAPSGGYFNSNNKK